MCTPRSALASWGFPSSVAGDTPPLAYLYIFTNTSALSFQNTQTSELHWSDWDPKNTGTRITRFTRITTINTITRFAHYQFW